MSKNVELVGLSTKEAACVMTSIRFAMSKGAGETAMGASLRKVIEQMCKTFSTDEMDDELSKMKGEEGKRINEAEETLKKHIEQALRSEKAEKDLDPKAETERPDADDQNDARMIGIVMPRGNWDMVFVCLGRWFCEMQGQKMIDFENDDQKATLIQSMGKFLQKIKEATGTEDASNADSSNDEKKN